MDDTVRLPGTDLLEKVETAVAGAAIAILVLAIFVDVFFRQVVGYPILWLQEVSMFSFIWLTFIGAAVAVRRNSHYRIELIPMLFKSRRVLIVVDVAVVLISLVFAAILAYQGLGFTEMGLKRVSRPSGVPLIYVFGTLPICGLSACYFLMERLFRIRAQGRHS